jgi:signal transduction histidine kinase
VAVDGPAARAAPALLAGAYLITVRPSLGSGGSQLSTALANAVSYGGFFAAGRFAVGKLRGDSVKLAESRNETLKERERLAAERQRNLEHRLLHDSALQTLEGIASGLVGNEDTVRDRARGEARRLRRALAGDNTRSTLEEALERLADEYSTLGLEVTNLVAQFEEPTPQVAAALVEAVREALRNVTKHAETSAVIVRADTVGSGVQVTIRDHGCGFDPAKMSRGFGLTQSVEARMTEVGGTARVWSLPGRGTRVTLWAPMA